MTRSEPSMAQSPPLWRDRTVDLLLVASCACTSPRRTHLSR
ncbi:hypothetical protein [Actinokineospora diospyrosa]|nr:hypothetical protein [Actinokineospora diospyrosa]